jgi:hypothetical protein
MAIELGWKFCTNVGMGTKHTSTDYSPEALEHLAERISSHAERYKSIAAQMRELQSKSLTIPYPSHIADGLEGIRKHVFQAELAIAKLLDCPPEHRELPKVAETPELFLTPVGKNKPPVVKPKSDSSTKKKAE